MKEKENYYILRKEGIAKREEVEKQRIEFRRKYDPNFKEWFEKYKEERK